MCRNIKSLFNFEPVATESEIRASAIQFVRKISGFTKPSKVNEAQFELAVNKIEYASRELIDSLTTSAPPKNREQEAEKAKLRNESRFKNTNLEVG